MRGPMVRIQSDIRRLWRCPKCHYERRAPATQTAVRCHCEKDAPFMQLVEAQRPPRSTPKELPPYYEYEADAGDEVENQEKAQAETAEVPPQVKEESTASTETPSITPEENPDNSTLDPGP